MTSAPPTLDLHEDVIADVHAPVDRMTLGAGQAPGHARKPAKPPRRAFRVILACPSIAPRQEAVQSAPRREDNDHAEAVTPAGRTARTRKADRLGAWGPGRVTGALPGRVSRRVAASASVPMAREPHA